MSEGNPSTVMVLVRGEALLGSALSPSVHVEPPTGKTQQEEGRGGERVHGDNMRVSAGEFRACLVGFDKEACLVGCVEDHDLFVSQSCKDQSTGSGVNHTH